jgi:hypothetical protein
VIGHQSGLAYPPRSDSRLPIGPPHQSERTGGHNVQLRPNVHAWTPPLPYTPMSYHYTYIHTTTTIYPESDVGYATISFRDNTILRLGGTQSSVFARLTPPVQDRLRAPQSDPRAQAQQDCRTTRP